jgi:tetratricopeptide (TPR) repeat protein
LLAAVARCANSQMRLLEGADLLRQAWGQLGDRDGDHRVFVQLEMGRYLLLTGNLDAARLMLEHLPNRAISEFLRRLGAYYLLALAAAAANTEAEPGLRESLTWFHAAGHITTAVAHQRMLASLRRAAGAPDEARALLEEGLSWCPGRELAFCRALLHNDLAHLHNSGQRLELALKQLDLSLAEAEFPYARIDALDLKGRFLLEAGQLDEAATLLADALTLAREAGTLIILPSLAYHIGLCHDRRGEPALARHFYAQGYAGAMQLLEHGLPATAVRLKAIQAHVEALQRAPLSEPTAAPAPDPGGEALAFALEHNLKDIRTLFQTALLEQAVTRWGSQQESARQLGLALRTAGNIRRRYRELGQPALPLDLRQLVDLDRDHDWKQLNHNLDDRILLWLADRHKGSLRELSERLEVNYAHLSSLISQARKRTRSQRKDSTS